ncbi:DUF2339 domain-containing protein [Pseudonocardia xishanensis]|uniref:DUF2339 domain-containing protein n=1 Tax=Pseudonocardia xishanensis TaxID=630995 RepID=A0ABP8RM98_9PSEU
MLVVVRILHGPPDGSLTGMSSPTGRPPAVDERVAAVAAELRWLGDRVGTLSMTLNALVGELRPGAADAAAERSAGAVGVPVGPSVDPTRPPVPPRVSDAPPTPAAWPAPPGGLPHAFPIGPRRPTWVDRLRTVSSAALLATIGGAVTLLGVVLLLVLAASRGWFGPEARVAAGAALGIVLVGLGAWLRRRDQQVGAQALAATGFAALFLSVAAGTALYALLPDLLGGVLALVVACAALAVADRWGSQPLAVGAVVGAGLLTPVVADGPTAFAAALVLALQLAVVPVLLRRGWAAPGVVAAVWAALFGAGAAANSAEAWPELLAVGLAALVVGSAAALGASFGRVRVAPVAAILAGAPLPALAVAGGEDLVWPALAAAVVTAGFAGWRRLAGGVRATAVALAGLSLLVATVTALDGTAQHLVLLGEGVVLLTAAAGLRNRPLLAVGGAIGLVGLIAVLADELPVEALVRAGRFADLPAGLAAGVLLLAAAVAALVGAGRVGLVRADAGTALIWAPLALVALYGATGTVVAAALLVSDTRTGFLAGHALVTVSWTVAALVLLARGLARPALRVAGLVLVAAAVGKLVLFDLVALDGLARVGAFLGAGLVLLAAGSRYARLVARRERAH